MGTKFEDFGTNLVDIFNFNASFVITFYRLLNFNFKKDRTIYAIEQKAFVALFRQEICLQQNSQMILSLRKNQDSQSQNVRLL